MDGEAEACVKGVAIIKYWHYFKYVVRHKWYVFWACMHMGVPIWQALIHDWQKFTPTEWSPYAESFYGPWKYNERPQWLVDKFNAAWLHHIHYGPHHWQHWILQEDDGDTLLLEMPARYIREMIADWVGAGFAILGKNNIHLWYHKNRDNIQLHPRTREILEIWLESAYGVPRRRNVS